MINSRQSVIGGRIDGKAVLGALKEVRIVSSKPVLPAELLSDILDLLSAEDLISCAQVSKRMREMVYDDTRWVQRLRLMGSWDEATARKWTESSTTLEDLAAVPQQAQSVDSPHRTTLRTQSRSLTGVLPQGSHDLEPMSSKLEDGRISPASSARGTKVEGRPSASDYALTVLDNVQSRRGTARQEYGKVHQILAPLYNDAIKAVTPANAKLFRQYRDPEQQAKMVSQLIRFSKADMAQGWRARQAQMSTVCQAFEGAIFSEFEQGMQSSDVKGRMMRYAHVLFHLNGGQRSITYFLSQSQILTSPYKLGDASACISVGHTAQFLPKEFLKFLRNLEDALRKECKMIEEVFPQPTKISEQLIAKVSEFVLETYLKKLFESLEHAGTEQLLLAVPTTYVQNLSLAESLEPAIKTTNTDVLEKKIQTIYEQFIDDYLKSELDWFQQRSDAEVTSWERQLSQQDASLEARYMANFNRQADKRDFLSSFKKVVMAPMNIFPTIGSSGKTSVDQHPKAETSLSVSSFRNSRAPTEATQVEMQHSDLGRSRSMSRSPSVRSEVPNNELEAKAAIMQSRLEGIRSLFSLEVALTLVHTAKKSIERANVFTRHPGIFQNSARKCCESIFVILVQTLGERHVHHGFNQAVEHLSSYNPRTVSERDEFHMVAPLVTFIELVNVGDLIQQMIELFFEQELVATDLTDKNDFLSETVKAKKRFEQMLDERVAAGLNKGIEVLMAEVEYICATTQRGEDFNPGGAGLVVNQVIDINITETAQKVVRLVAKHCQMLVGSTDKNMLDVFNQEIGLRLFSVLCKHLKRQRISVIGAPRLMSDMNHYFEFVQTLRNSDLLQYFRAMRELSHVFLIDGANAKELAIIIADHDRFSGIFGVEEVLEFAERRADWYQIKPKVEKAMYGIGCCTM